MPRSSHGDKYTVSVVRTEEDRGNSIIFKHFLFVIQMDWQQHWIYAKVYINKCSFINVSFPI